MGYYSQKIKSSVKQVPKSSVCLLWHHGYWDGPLSGACQFNGERLWFSCYDEGLRHRKFVLLRLSDEQWKDIDFAHGLFQDYVGTHTDYDENGKREIQRGLKPRVESNYAKFYDWAKENPREEPHGEQVGWYRNPCNLEKK
jgi:hypothetical protein